MKKTELLFLSGLFDDRDHERLLSGPEIQITAEAGGGATVTYESGFSTGEPIAALVLSASQKSHHYQQFSGKMGKVRPGHTDLVKHHKTGGFDDYRGGGRSSYRSTITDVIGGSVARIFLQQTFETRFLSSIIQVGELQSDQHLSDRFTDLRTSPEEIQQAEEIIQQAKIPTIDTEFADEAAELIKQTRSNGDSIGAVVELVGLNIPPLIGEPLYNSLKTRLMGSLGGLHAVRACEVGAGADVAGRKGSENNDPIRKTGYQSNNHGGMLGGITTGMPLRARVTFKPTSTIMHSQKSVRKNLEEIDFELEKGRHDPCVGVRAGVTLESRMAIEIMNAVLMQQSGVVDSKNFQLFE